MSVKKVEGKNNRNKVFLYTLSTCGWCKKTKQMLKDHEVEYEYLDVDTATSEERREAIRDLNSRGAPIGFPTIIINDDDVITGFKEAAIKEALGL